MQEIHVFPETNKIQLLIQNGTYNWVTWRRRLENVEIFHFNWVQAVQFLDRLASQLTEFDWWKFNGQDKLPLTEPPWKYSRLLHQLINFLSTREQRHCPNLQLFIGSLTNYSWSLQNNKNTFHLFWLFCWN